MLRNRGLQKEQGHTHHQLVHWQILQNIHTIHKFVFRGCAIESVWDEGEGDLLAGRQELLHQGEERSTVSVQPEASLTRTEQLQQQPNSLTCPGLSGNLVETLNQRVHKPTQL